MRMLTVTAAAAYAGCSRRYVERLLKGKDYRRLLRLAAGKIDADFLADHCSSARQFRTPGRPLGMRFLFRLTPAKSKRPPARDDAWRVDRALRLIKLIKDRDGLEMIAKALTAQGITPAGSPKT